MVSNLRNRWKRVSESGLDPNIATLAEWRLQHPYLQFYANNTRELLSSRPCVLYFIGLLGKPNLTWIRLWRYSQAADDEIPFDFIPSPHNKACLGLYFP